MLKLLVLTFTLLLTCGWFFSHGEVLYRSAVLQDPSYFLQWESDFTINSTTFTVQVETLGFVGFGLSYTGGMEDADIFIGGVNSDGSLYSGDYHGKLGGVDLDLEQNWVLLEGQENSTHTTLKFSRLWETCDKNSQDISITQDVTNLIWSFGTDDQVTYHGTTNRGTKPTYLLDPANPEVDKSDLLTWAVEVTHPLPSDDTVYYCSIHKAPQLTKKHHIVGFRAKIEGEEATRHTHHFVIYKCIPPNGTNAFDYFEQYVGKEGGDCYVPEPVLPVQDCQYFVYIWSVGGEETFLPDGIGYPFGLEEHEYYMVDLHYDNPDKIPNLNFTTGAEIFYTDDLKPTEAAALSLGHKIFSSQLIPPQTTWFKTIGHCSSNCTARYLPSEGITVFNAYLHSHTAGRKVKIRHFRDGKELPWLAYDDHYNFDYQQSRHLRTHIKLLPGDHLTYECTYNTMDRDGVTTAGISTRTEMCYAALWHYPPSTLEYCMSQFPIQKHFDRWGIEEVEWFHTNYPPTILKPERFKGMDFIEFLDNQTLPWDVSLSLDIEKQMLQEEHESTCYAPTAEEVPGDPYYAWTKYPEYEAPYAPDNVCNAATEEPGTPPTSTGTPPTSTGTPPTSTGTPPTSTETPPTSTPPTSTGTSPTSTETDLTSTEFLPTSTETESTWNPPTTQENPSSIPTTEKSGSTSFHGLPTSLVLSCSLIISVLVILK